MTTYFICERCGRSKARSLYHNRIKINHICATCTRRLREGGFRINNAKNKKKELAQRSDSKNPIPPASSRGIDS